MNRSYFLGLFVGLCIIGAFFYASRVIGETTITNVYTNPAVTQNLSNSRPGQPIRIIEPAEGNDYSEYPYLYPVTLGLRLGNTGNPVRSLQVILNNDSDTQVGARGAGSAGFETTSFGSKTRLALLKFQRKYALFQTGYVDLATFNKINLLLSGVDTNATSTAATLIGQAANAPQSVFSNYFSNYPSSLNGPTITTVTPTTVHDGDTVTITGTGFLDLNKITTGFDHFDDVPSTDGRTITFVFRSRLQTDTNRQIAASGNSRRQSEVRAAFERYTANRPFPFFLMVSNGNGTSNTFRGIFQLR